MKAKKTKAVVIRNRGYVCVALYLSALCVALFVFLSFLDSYAIASETVANSYYSGVEIALGVSGLTLNYLLLSCLIVGTVGGLLTLIVAIICSVSKKYSPLAAMLMALSIAALTYAFIVSLLFPIVISDSLNQLSDPATLMATTWPIYVMSGLLGLAMINTLGLLIYSSVDAYGLSNSIKAK